MMKKRIATIAAAVGIACGAYATEWDLSSVWEWMAMPSSGLADGDVATGEQSHQVFKALVIADGATVTLRGVTISPDHDKPSGTTFYSGTQKAGIECLGDATLILEGANLVKSFDENYPGIFVPQGV